MGICGRIALFEDTPFSDFRGWLQRIYKGFSFGRLSGKALRSWYSVSH